MKLEVNNISKKYDKKEILKKISFVLKEGEICGLVGVNGAGKSTLMKILMGLIQANSGEILIDDNRTEKINNIDGVIEKPALYENLSAYDNLKVKALLNDISDKKIRDILNTVGLENNKVSVKKYSMGMKMRLGIALAILNDPKFLVLDEPFNGLDPIGVKQLNELIKNLSSKNTTILISSHQLDTLIDISDHIVMINDGEKAIDTYDISKENIQQQFFNIVNGIQ